MAFVVFLLLALGSVFFAANVVLRRNPATCAVHLVGTFLCLSGIYLLIGFPFLAAIQLMVYAGAIMVLFLFVIMLLDLHREKPREPSIASTFAPVVAAALLAGIALVFPAAEVSTRGTYEEFQGTSAASGGEGLAIALFSRHVIAFEAASILLLTGILGVVVLAKRRSKKKQTLTDLLASAEAEPSDPETELAR